MYKLPETLIGEIEHYGTLIDEYLAGDIDPVKFKSVRVPMGIYEQRTDGTYMVRVRCVGGYISPRQLNQVALIARKQDASVVHITTRQELQIQNVELDKTLLIVQDLFDAGLASRGGGGNTVRNIMASVDAGISHDEVFDVTPYAVALTNKLIAEPDSWTLPRKFKISFSGSEKDNAYAAFNDLGFIARIKNGKRGFQVYIGGSLGAKAMVGHVLFDFAPEEDLYYITDAVKKLFSRYGNRRNKHKARLRFVFYKLGKEKVFELFHTIFNEIKKTEDLPFEIEKHVFPTVVHQLEPELLSSQEFETWEKRYVIEQKQHDLLSIIIPFDHGNIDCDKLFKIAEFIEQFGDDVIRFSMRQNIHLRNIPSQYLGNVYNFLSKLEISIHEPFLLNSLVSCTGSDTCRLGICMAKGALSSIRKELGKNNLPLDDLNNLNINISGCPNSCGQHKAADIGFYGKVGRNDRMYPAYVIVAGAVIGNNQSRLAEPIDEISARDMPEFIRSLLNIYISQQHKYESFTAYIDSRGKKDISELCEKFRSIPGWNDDKNYYFDWGADQIFSLVGKGIGECSAGIFDMIDVDMNTIRKYQDEIKGTEDISTINELLYGILFSASRMLLVTRGVEPKNTNEVFNGFIEQFIEFHLVSNEYLNIIEVAKGGKHYNYIDEKDTIYNLATDVIELYDGMDDSLQFDIPKEMKPEDITIKIPILKKDYRGVVCPMNFVKTKIDLAPLKSGDQLEVLLDDGEPIENVPGSVKMEGHKIIRQTKIDDYWSVIIEKR